MSEGWDGGVGELAAGASGGLGRELRIAKLGRPDYFRQNVYVGLDKQPMIRQNV